MGNDNLLFIPEQRQETETEDQVKEQEQQTIILKEDKDNKQKHQVSFYATETTADNVQQEKQKSATNQLMTQDETRKTLEY